MFSSTLKDVQIHYTEGPCLTWILGQKVRISGTVGAESGEESTAVLGVQNFISTL